MGVFSSSPIDHCLTQAVHNVWFVFSFFYKFVSIFYAWILWYYVWITRIHEFISTSMDASALPSVGQLYCNIPQVSIPSLSSLK